VAVLHERSEEVMFWSLATGRVLTGVPLWKIPGEDYFLLCQSRIAEDFDECVVQLYEMV
jgi:hypothetical protein